MKNFKSFSLFPRFQGNLKVFMKQKKKFTGHVLYISGGKSCLMLGPVVQRVDNAIQCYLVDKFYQNILCYPWDSAVCYPLSSGQFIHPSNYLSLIHKFTNHAHLSVKFSHHVSVLALSMNTFKPFATSSVDAEFSVLSQRAACNQAYVEVCRQNAFLCVLLSFCFSTMLLFCDK